MTTTKIAIEYKYQGPIDKTWGWELLINGEPFDGPYATLDTALEMARLETVGGPALDVLLARGTDIEALRDVLTKYKVWVDEMQPYSGTKNLDARTLDYEDFDEQRADWYQEIVVMAEAVAGFTWDERDHIGAGSGRS